MHIYRHFETLHTSIYWRWNSVAWSQSRTCSNSCYSRYSYMAQHHIWGSTSRGVFWRSLPAQLRGGRCHLPFVGQTLRHSMERHSKHGRCMAVRLKASANLKGAKRDQKGKVRVSAIMWNDSIRMFSFSNLCRTLEIAPLSVAARAQQNSSTHCTKSEQRHARVGGLR